jgi:hypothetical protein
MKVLDLPVAEVRKEEVSVGEGEGGVELEDGKDVTVVADAWGQGVVVILLGREINDNGVENQAKLIIYVHQTLKDEPYWNISLSQVYFPQRRT